MRLKRLYRPTLNWSLDHPKWVVIPSVLLILAAALALSQAGRAFVPEFNDGTLMWPSATLEYRGRLSYRTEHDGSW
jgi:Cu/Ag efflux pump CusA